jgi:hypothetical protein
MTNGKAAFQNKTGRQEFTHPNQQAGDAVTGLR